MNKIFTTIIIALVALYLASCFGPLRLEYDSLKYFRLEDCLENNCPPGFNTVNDTLPHGYVLLLFILSKTGLLKTFFIAFINLVYLLAGIWFVTKIFKKDVNAKWIFLIALLNWTFIKLFSYPLSEMQFLFFSCGSLYWFVQYAEKRKIGLLLLSFAFVILATLTRGIGIALLPALLIGIAALYRPSTAGTRVTMIAAFMVTAVIIALLFSSALMGSSHYATVFSDNHPHKRTIDYIIQLHFTELGQLLINLPIGKVASSLPPVILATIFIGAGVAVVGVLFWTLFVKRKIIPVVITAYMMAYMMMVFYWSYNDPRFWVPVIPLFIAILLQSPFIKSGAGKWIGRLVLVSYGCMACIALAYALYISFNKKEFARSQANGIFKTEYEIHFFGRSFPDSTGSPDPYVLGVLEKVDTH